MNHLTKIFCLSASAVSLVAQTTIVDFDTEPNGSGSFFINDNPLGGWTVGSGVSTFDTGFSSTTVIGVGNSPAGTAPLMIGGASGSYASDTSLPSVPEIRTLQNSSAGANNTFVNRVDTGGVLFSTRAAFVVESENWLSSTAGGVSLDSYQIDIVRLDVSSANANLRALVRDGGNYHVSTTAVTSEDTLSLDFSAETWVNLGSSGDSLLTTEFGSYSGASSITFSQVDAVGFIYEYSIMGDSGDGNQDLRIGNFEVTATAIPEPSTYALFASILGLGVIYFRRRKA